MIKNSRSTLFLMEQVIVITVFAVCAAICARILVASYLMTTTAVDTKNALFIAESTAESYKAFAGNTAQVAELIGNANSNHNNHMLVVYFDTYWQPTQESYASFVLHLQKRDAHPLVMVSDITVSRVATGDELVQLTVATRERGVL